VEEERGEMGANQPNEEPGSGAELLSEPTADGEQTLIPGVRPVSLRDSLELRVEAPLRPTRYQKPLDIGLFDLAARNQLDLF
jgi:hypothetical protein